ncbi:cold shock domain-containing protein [Myxococcota bacterium]|nr:cold shock domain-containing protein [Myxococcota bacterium]MCZ7619375.1 cold shock domain-containing protein [Myxococcota bacterium]
MQIQWVDMQKIRSEERDAVEDRLRALGNGHTDLIDVRIVAKQSNHHRHGGQEVRIAGLLRGKELAAARTRPDLSLALHEAVEAFIRELRRFRDRRDDRRSELASTPPLLGIVDRIFRDEGYGFILTDSGEQVYFHRNAVHDGLVFEQLTEGQRVGLDLEAGREGLQATTVGSAPPDAPAP